MSLNSKVKRLIILVAVLFLFVGGAGLVTYKSLNDGSKGVEFNNNQEEFDRMNILLLGSDEKQQGQSRADTLMVVSVDLTTGKAGLLSIPRDTRVKLPGYNGYNKINAAYSYGGIDLTKEAVEELLQINVDYYLKLDYQGFVKIVDTLGGVEVNIEKDLKYVDQADDLYIDLKAGQNNLTGSEALGYVRFRHDALGDISRIERQQKFIAALVDKILTPKVILRLPQLVREYNNYIKTDIKLNKMFSLAGAINKFSINKIETEMLPGKPQYIEGISYWLPCDEEMRLLVNSLIRDKSYLNHKDIGLTILNGNGISGIANRLSNLLSRQGYRIEKIDNADNFNYSKNIIISSKENAEGLQELIDYLEGELIIDEDSNEIKVIIGQNIDKFKVEQGFSS